MLDRLEGGGRVDRDIIRPDLSQNPYVKGSKPSIPY